jgi:peptidoglycan/LPS O-acetylase OafA/YrhL
MGILRLILAIAVVIAHSSYFFSFKFTGGIVAVETFFIISGFYMTMIL